MILRSFALGVLLLTGCEENGQASAKAPSPTHSDSTPVIVVDRPTIIGFFPKPQDSSEANDDGYSEGVAHVGFALKDAEKCLGRDSSHTELVIDTAVRIRRGARVDTLRFPRIDSLSYGVYLVGPTTDPKLVSVYGPSQLIQAVPEAIPEYFGRPTCQKALTSAVRPPIER